MSGSEVGRGIFAAVAVVVLGALLTGCATAGKQIDLGDGMIFDLVPVSAAAKAVDLAKPGYGAGLIMVEELLAKRLAATNAPFNGLPFNQDVVILLKEPVEGLTITPDQISTIRRTSRAVVPEPIVEEITLDQLWTGAAGGQDSGWAAILGGMAAIQSNLAAGATAPAVPGTNTLENLLLQFQAARDAMTTDVP